MAWTKEQQKVIDVRDKNILVSAAAGSGKTAVLVQRIIKMVTDEKNPIDVDKLLVVTFTNAAASEMRERVMQELVKLAAVDTENEHLQKQLTYIQNAKITTIDSFCLSILREHFSEINIDPGFRIANKDELELIMSDVVSEMISEYYEEGEDEFLDFIENYLDKRGGSAIEGVVLQLYSFSMSNPFPRKWIEGLADNYTDVTKENIYNFRWFKNIVGDIKDSINREKNQLFKAIEYAEDENGPKPYLEALLRDHKFATDVLNAKDFLDICRLFKEYEKPSNLKRVSKKEGVDEKLKKKVIDIRTLYKKTFEKLRVFCMRENLEDEIDYINKCGTEIKMLIKLATDFLERFSKIKREKNIVDFNDIEHFALEILVREEDGKYYPTDTAKEISRDFVEIMIDEYQDSNYVQEYILNAVSAKQIGRNNIFMVGDVKQSIYKFRQAKPEMFLEKYASYPTNDSSDEIRISLSKNFRSRHEVLEFSNLIFSQTMHTDFGNIDYDEDNALHPGFLQDDNGEDYSTEIIVVDTNKKSEGSSTYYMDNGEELGDGDDEDTAKTKQQLEAVVIADRIKKMVEGDAPLQITDKNTGRLRCVRYSDIAIILRSMNGLGENIPEVFWERGIPVKSLSSTGYFDAFEVKTILNFLSIIDNPLQDIALVSVLKNVYEFNENELSDIRIGKKGNFYNAVLDYHGIYEGKVAKFLSDLEGFREMVPYTSIYDLINICMDTTGFREYILAMPLGNKRIANVEMLLDKAVKYENTSFSGLFSFVRYIEKIQKYNIDQGEALDVDGGEDCVRLMTIHKSKGLEFPVVFLSETCKQFNANDVKGKIVIHPEMGVGIDYVDNEKRLKYKTMIRNAIISQITCENLAEEMRVLYVALTRAREKVVVTGCGNISQIIEKNYDTFEEMNERIPAYALKKSNNYIGWIIQALIRHKSFAKHLISIDKQPLMLSDIYDRPADISFMIINSCDVVYSSLTRKALDLNNKSILSNWCEKNVDYANVENVRNKLKFTYKFAEDTTLKSKVSVSDVKHANMIMSSHDVDRQDELQVPTIIETQSRDERVEIGTPANETISIETVEAKTLDKNVGDMPNFLQETQENQGALRGIAYHRVFELIDYSIEVNDIYDVRNMMENMVLSAKISREAIELVSGSKIFTFLQSNIGKRMKEAFLNNKLYREKQFVMGVKASDIWKENNSNELVLVQGIIDACFEENGKMVVVDYKTDNIDNIIDLDLRYKTQLILYKEAVERSLGSEVAELIIYSTKHGKELVIEG